jgi:hypothetical protein
MISLLIIFILSLIGYATDTTSMLIGTGVVAGVDLLLIISLIIIAKSIPEDKLKKKISYYDRKR